MASGGKSKYKHQQLESLMLNILDNALKTEINDEKLLEQAERFVRDMKVIVEFHWINILVELEYIDYIFKKT